MKIITKVCQIRQEIQEVRNENKTVGFVPTMGYLHEGHLSLMRAAKEENEIVVASIFVNPTQFGPEEDLDKYPRDLEKDTALAQKAGVDLLFIPTVQEVYPSGFNTYVEVHGDITNKLCGKSRPGHFKGVTTVVSKLFNIVMPDKAYFGQKDAQQVAVIEQMVRDLNHGVEIVVCPIIREADGLALSSRNVYLSEQERKDSLMLSQSLIETEKMIRSGTQDVHQIKGFIREKIGAIKSATIDYIEIVNAKTLEDIDIINGDVLIAIAVKIGKTRLIDNLKMEGL